MHFANRYEIECELGRGGFGVVYLAQDTKLNGRRCALKVLHPQLAVDPSSLRFFENEVKALAGLRHDHIVRIQDADVWDGQRFLVMDYIEGSSLAQVVAEQGAQPPEKVTDWLIQAADALSYAHGKNLLHRDIKSANLLLETARNRIFLSDFGLVLAVENSGGSSASEDAKTLTGTAAYRAPEVSELSYTAAGDLYSLGVVAYELLAGRRPFIGNDPLSLLHAHANRPVPPLPSTTPPDLAAIVLRLLAKTPAERYPDALSLLSALRGVGKVSGMPPWLSASGSALLLAGIVGIVTWPFLGGDLLSWLGVVVGIAVLSWRGGYLGSGDETGWWGVGYATFLVWLWTLVTIVQGMLADGFGAAQWRTAGLLGGVALIAGPIIGLLTSGVAFWAVRTWRKRRS